MAEPIRLYLDEDTINQALINALRSRNIDILTAQEAELRGRSDQVPIGVIVRRLLKLLNARSAAEMQDWLEYLSNWR